jgi:hypothetical protein
MLQNVKKSENLYSTYGDRSSPQIREAIGFAPPLKPIHAG